MTDNAPGRQRRVGARFAPTARPSTASMGLPRPTPQPPALPPPCDRPYPGVLDLLVDATDLDRAILSARLALPVTGPGPLTLLYPKWMPGYHAPQNPIALFAGLEIRAGDRVLDWRRDPVEVHAFHVVVPEGVAALDIRYQFLSPTTASQGDIIVTHDILNLQWGRLTVYPAGWYARGLTVQARLILPPDWTWSSALAVCAQEDDAVVFAPVSLDVLVDTPVMAGRYALAVPLDTDVEMTLFAHDRTDLAPGEAQVNAWKRLVHETCHLFGSRHFDRYRFLVALSDEVGGGGVEHHRSAEIVAKPRLFADWEHLTPLHDVTAHEFTHSWNGKFRRGADSWTPSFEVPIRNDLMWVYEGQTQYWGHVLTARSGLWSTDTALEALAKVAATYDVRPGEMWRTMADTTRDPIIAGRQPLPWPSWQRSEDYYAQGQLMWLTIDTLIRELTDDVRSLDDFAAAFFGIDDGSMITAPYVFDDVVAALDAVAPHDWASFIHSTLESRGPGAPLEGLARGGYRLVYRDHRTAFCRQFDALYDQLDLRFSIGFTVAANGTLQEVMWGSPAFEAGLASGSSILSVNGAPFALIALSEAVDATGRDKSASLVLGVVTRSYRRDVAVTWSEGHRFPHLERIEGARARLDDILQPALLSALDTARVAPEASDQK